MSLNGFDNNIKFGAIIGGLMKLWSLVCKKMRQSSKVIRVCWLKSVCMILPNGMLLSNITSLGLNDCIFSNCFAVVFGVVFNWHKVMFFDGGFDVYDGMYYTKYCI